MRIVLIMALLAIACIVSAQTPTYHIGNDTTDKRFNLHFHDNILWQWDGAKYTAVEASGGGGEANTGQNTGGGQAVFRDKLGVVLRYKTLLAGAGITYSSTDSTLTITSSNGETNTASNLGSTGGRVFSQKAGVDLQFRRIIGTGRITATENTNDITITTTGEANTGANLGAGHGVFGSKVGEELQFKSLIAGPNVSLSSTSTGITITGLGGSGETNTASNIGNGSQVFKDKLGVDLRFRTLVAGANTTLTQTDTTISIATTGGSDITYTNPGYPYIPIWGSPTRMTRSTLLSYDTTYNQFIAPSIISSPMVGDTSGGFYLAGGFSNTASTGSTNSGATKLNSARFWVLNTIAGSFTTTLPWALHGYEYVLTNNAGASTNTVTLNVVPGDTLISNGQKVTTYTLQPREMVYCVSSAEVNHRMIYLFSSLSSGGGVTGSGVAGRVAYWNATNSITSEAALAYDDANNRLSAGQIRLENGSFNLPAYSFQNATASGWYHSGSGVLNEVVNSVIRRTILDSGNQIHNYIGNQSYNSSQGHTTTTNIVGSHHIWGANTTSGQVTMMLPNASAGATFIIVKEKAANNLQICPQSGQELNNGGASNCITVSASGAYTAVSLAGGWYVKP